MSDEEKPGLQDTVLQPFTDEIGDVRLAEELFGSHTEITWLKNTDWEHTFMTLTRDGNLPATTASTTATTTGKSASTGT